MEDNIIKYDHNIEKIEKNNNQIILTFNESIKVICDHLIISDGVFSKGKSLISNNEIKPPIIIQLLLGAIFQEKTLII